MLLHTSGTTSRPKLVPLSGANLCAWARHIAASLALSAEDRCLNILPLFHIHRRAAAVPATLASAGSVVLTDGIYASDFAGWLQAFRPTRHTAVPTMYPGILARAAEHRALLREARLRFVRSSSALLPRAAAAVELLPGAGAVGGDQPLWAFELRQLEAGDIERWPPAAPTCCWSTTPGAPTNCSASALEAMWRRGWPQSC